jgi:hypothetical protein
MGYIMRFDQPTLYPCALISLQMTAQIQIE